MDLTEERPTITIRLKPALQDYIRYVMKLEGNVFESPLLVATSRSYLGRLVAPFIEIRPMEAKPILPGIDRELFTFRIVNYRSLETRRNTAWISERNQINIQNIIEAHFRLHFRDDRCNRFRFNFGNGLSGNFSNELLSGNNSLICGTIVDPGNDDLTF